MNGIASIKNKLLNDILSILFIKANILPSPFIFFLTIFLNFLHKKKLTLHPIIVAIHEIKNPIILPNAIVLIAINTDSGSAGIIDSSDITNIPTNILKKILLLLTKSCINVTT